MEAYESQEGSGFVRAIATYIRRHEQALANRLQIIEQRKSSQGLSTSSSSIASTFGLGSRSQQLKSSQLSFSPHHLFFLLSKIEELEVNIGPTNVRIESLGQDAAAGTYISFLQHRPMRDDDAASLRSISSIRSVMSNMSTMWSGFSLSSGISRAEKAKAALDADLKYIYAAFTKIPSLRLCPDHRLPLIKDFEQFPCDSAVPLFAFKNVRQLEISDLDFRCFHGWDRLAAQLTHLTVKRANVDDPVNLLVNIVLDDAEKRRRRSNPRSVSSTSTISWSSPSTPLTDYDRSDVDATSPQHTTPSTSPPSDASLSRREIEVAITSPARTGQNGSGTSPKRPSTVRNGSSYRHARTYSTRARRTTSNQQLVSEQDLPERLSEDKWQNLVHLSLANNNIIVLPHRALEPLQSSLRFLNLSCNLFEEVPESLSRLGRLTSLDLSNCMLESLAPLLKCKALPLTTLILRTNRLKSLAGVEGLLMLENLNIQDNRLTDPMDTLRLTSNLSLRKLWVRHNPFTKRFPEYRVQIMNNFRKSGHEYDVILDDQVASYVERGQLVERRKLEVINTTIPLSQRPAIHHDMQGYATMMEMHKPSDQIDVSSSRRAVIRHQVNLVDNHTSRPSTAEQQTRSVA